MYAVNRVRVLITSTLVTYVAACGENSSSNGNCPSGECGDASEAGSGSPTGVDASEETSGGSSAGGRSGIVTAGNDGGGSGGVTGSDSAITGNRPACERYCDSPPEDCFSRPREECLGTCESAYVGLDSACAIALDAMNDCVAALQPDQYDCDPGLHIDAEPCGPELATVTEQGCLPTMAGQQ